jgi:hypothetical protein
VSPTPEVSERQRKAAFKAWETIRRKLAAKTKSESSETAGMAEAKKTGLQRLKTSEMKEATVEKAILAGRNPEHAYPNNWKQIGIETRERARNADGLEQCECHGQCLKHLGRCEEINHTWPKQRRRKGKVKIRFTVAHLCHTPKCDDKSHLRAVCEPCHLIYDLRCRQRGLRGSDAVAWAMQQHQESEFVP